MLGDDGGHKLMNGAVVGNIDGMALETRNEGACRGTQSFELLLAPVRDSNRGTFFQKSDTYGTAQAAGASGDQHDLSGESFTHRGPAPKRSCGPFLKKSEPTPVLL